MLNVEANHLDNFEFLGLRYDTYNFCFKRKKKKISSFTFDYKSEFFNSLKTASKIWVWFEDLRHCCLYPNECLTSMSENRMTLTSLSIIIACQL